MTHIPPVFFPAPWRRYRHTPGYATRTCLYFIFPPDKLQIQTHTGGSVWIRGVRAGLYGTLDAPHRERWRMTPHRHPGAAHGHHTGRRHLERCSSIAMPPHGAGCEGPCTGVSQGVDTIPLCGHICRGGYATFSVTFITPPHPYRVINTTQISPARRLDKCRTESLSTGRRRGKLPVFERLGMTQGFPQVFSWFASLFPVDSYYQPTEQGAP